MTTLREAAQQALEALEQDNPAGRGATITALRAALDAPPPEPVGWVYIDRATGERTFSRHMAGVVNHTEVVEVPVYAEPPRREWQGLTEDEQRLCAQAMDAEPLAEGWSELGKFARAIEAALRERNT